MGQLIPVGCVEVLPGDTFQASSSALIRVSPLNTPVMHPVQVRLHHWFVPNRIVWDEWEDFITDGPDGNATPVLPTVKNTGGPKGVLAYQGVDPGIVDADIMSLSLCGYNLIFNEFYRDQDLVQPRDMLDQSIANCAWEKDYFTAARPFAAKGDQVTAPMSSGYVTGLGKETQVFGIQNRDVYESGGSGQAIYDNAAQFNDSNPNTQFFVEEDPDNPGFPNLRVGGATSVMDMRRAFALQRYYEARARYGSRYTEYLQYLGVKPSDARLQRPEYLGGGRQTINFSEVLQTSDEAGQGQGVGNLYGHGIAALRTNRYRKFFEEHGYVHTLMSVRPKTMYTNSIPRHFFKYSNEMYYQKELEAIGQQEVFDIEVGKDATPGDVFGYQNRYEEYRKHFSYVTGEMRDVLNTWHLSREFDTSGQIALNEEFVTCTPSKRIHQVATNDVLWCMVQHNIRARRLVNKFAQSRVI